MALRLVPASAARLPGGHPRPSLRSASARTLARVFLLALAIGLGAGPAPDVDAGPFARWFHFTQPDGTRIRIRGEGDDFHAVFESADGYTVIHDPASHAYHYARLSPDGSAFVSTGVAVGRADPATLGLVPHLRRAPESVRQEATARRERWEAGMETDRRWKALKAARRETELALAADAAFSPPASATTGAKVGLCLLIDFDDDPAVVPQAEIVEFCNGDHYSGYGNHGSVKEYYLDNSGGLLTYTNVVTAYIRIPSALHPKGWYNDASIDAGTQANILIRDALDILRAQPNYPTEILPRFAPLSVESDGTVTACNVFYAGENGGVWSLGLWPHSWSLYEVGAQALSPGGKKIYRYQISNIGDSLELGTFCHENGHMLCDFPDIYDYDGDSAGGAGGFCLMNSGGVGPNPAQICAYLKRGAGWATVTELTSSSHLAATLRAAPDPAANHFYRFARPGVPTEYFLLENRQTTGRDAGIPGAGIAVWHVDELGNHNNQSLVTNSTHANYELTLVQADNRWDLEAYENEGDPGDLYHAGNPEPAYANRLDDFSTPATRWWNGTASGLRLSRFSTNGPVMTFDVGNGDRPLLTPTLTAEPASSPGRTNRIFWNSAGATAPAPGDPSRAEVATTTPPDQVTPNPVPHTDGVTSFAAVPPGSGKPSVTFTAPTANGPEPSAADAAGPIAWAESSTTLAWSGRIYIPDDDDRWVTGVNFAAPTGIPEGAVVTRVTVYHVIDHTWIDDLECRLSNGTHEWLLRSHAGGDGWNITETVTESVLFDGDSPAQTWHYRVRDTEPWDDGYLRAVRITIYYEVPRADLALQGYSWDPEVREFDWISVGLDVRNAGTGPAGASHARLYLSTDGDRDLSDDYDVGEVEVPALAEGATATVVWDFRLPNLGPGDYWVRAAFVGDSRGEIAETDENNLWLTSASFYVHGAPPAPDLEAQSVMWAGTNVAERSAFWVGAEIVNSGDLPAAASHVRLLLSPGNDWDVADDSVVGELEVPALAPGASKWVWWDFRMPDLGSGHYPVWMLFDVDSRHEVAERDENNLGKVPISFTAEDPPPPADLQATELGWNQPRFEEGELASFRARIANAGPGPAPASHARLYLSIHPDSPVTNEWFIGEIAVPAIPAGGAQWVRWDFYLPHLGTGEYPVWAVALVDSRDEVWETAEDNLTRDTVTLTAAEPPITYLAECSATEDFAAPKSSGWIAEQAFTFDSLEPDHTYWYRVKARQSGRETAWSGIEFSHQQGPPALAVTPDSINAGSIPVGVPTPVRFTVSNSGGGVVSGEASTAPPLAILSGSPFQLAAGETTEIVVSITPRFVAGFAGTVQFTTDAGDLDRPVSGSGHAWIAGRHVFYNGSAWDGNDPGPSPDDDHAIAPDKSALRPGGVATLANYTSYSRGLNGIMVDLRGLPASPAAGDFAFRTGRGSPPSQWTDAPTPSTVTVRRGEGLDASDRITLIWGADAVKKGWLEVTVQATSTTGLPQPDVFYFGNAIGETGNAKTDARVTSADALRVLAHTGTGTPIDSPFDLNRDGKVGAADRLLVLANLSALNALELLDLSGSPAPAARPPARAPFAGPIAWERTPQGVRARWIADGFPVAIRTTEDPGAPDWEPFDEVGGDRSAGEPMEALLPIDPDGPARFYRFESIPAR